MPPGTSWSSRETRSAGARQTTPESGGSSPEITCSRLDFPLPLRPIKRDALAGLDTKVRAFEERQVAEGERGPLEMEQRHNNRRASTAQTACASRRRS